MPDTYTIKRGATRPALRYSAGVDLTGATARFVMANRPGAVPVVDAPAEVAGEDLIYRWAATDTLTARAYYAEFRVTFPSGAVQVFPSDAYLAVEIMADLGGTAAEPIEPGATTGSGSATEGADTAAGAGTAPVTGSGLAIEGADTAIGAGSVANVAPTVTTQPSITGNTTTGSVLTLNEGAASGTPAPTGTIQWLRGTTAITGATGATYTLVSGDAGQAISARVTWTNSAGSVSATSNAITGQAAPTATAIGGTALGTMGAAGTIYEGYRLADGDDFDTAPDFMTPTHHGGAYMTTRHYGVQSGSPRYLRGAASLGGYEADPWHTGFADAGRGVVPTSFADTITVENSMMRLKSRRATAAEKAIMGPLSSKGNLSSMVHMARRNMMRAPCIMEMRLRFPRALSSWNQWHPTFWLLQSQPGNGWDGMELDCEGFGPQLEFYKHQWTNGTAAYGPLLGRTTAVSATEYRTFGFQIFESAGVWKVRLWDNGGLVAEADAGSWFDPSRPFHLMMTNHILQSGLDQSIFDAAGDAGADMECDWWRAWQPAGGAFRKPLTPAANLLTDFNAPFSFALPTPQEVWGTDVSSDVIEMIPNEDNTPAAPWVRGLLPASVTRTGDTLAGTISDRPGRLVLARSATPANGDGCVPQPITICVGPRITGLSDMALTAGDGVDIDVYAACDCGDLHMGKQITVAGLSGSGLAYNAQTGRITGTAAQGTHSLTIAVTNAVGQTASRQITLTVAAANPNPNPQPGTPAYAAWTGPGWFDFSDSATLTASAGKISAVANKRSGGESLTAQGADISTATGGIGGQQVARFTRDTSNPARLSAPQNGVISAMCRGEDKPYTVITVFNPTDANTGYIWSWSDTVDGSNSQQIALIRRASAQPSVRRQLVEAASNDVRWGTSHPANTPRIVAVQHTGTAVTIWDNSLTPAVNGAAQDVAAFNNQLAFYIGASETLSDTDPHFAPVACAMDMGEIVIEDRAVPAADVQQAITDLATKWGIALT